MKKRSRNIYIVIFVTFLIMLLFEIDMGVYDKNIYKVESKQIEIFTLHNIKSISTNQLGNLTCNVGALKDTKDVYIVSCYRKSSFYPLYRTIDIKFIKKIKNGEYSGALLYDQAAYYSILVNGDKLTYTKHKYDYSYYSNKFLKTSIVYFLLLVIVIYRNKTGGRNEEKK